MNDRIKLWGEVSRLMADASWADRRAVLAALNTFFSPEYDMPPTPEPTPEPTPSKETDR